MARVLPETPLTTFHFDPPRSPMPGIPCGACAFENTPILERCNQCGAAMPDDKTKVMLLYRQLMALHSTTSELLGDLPKRLEADQIKIARVKTTLREKEAALRDREAALLDAQLAWEASTHREAEKHRLAWESFTDAANATQRHGNDGWQARAAAFEQSLQAQFDVEMAKVRAAWAKEVGAARERIKTLEDQLEQAQPVSSASVPIKENKAIVPPPPVDLTNAVINMRRLARHRLPDDDVTPTDVCLHAGSSSSLWLYHRGFAKVAVKRLENVTSVEAIQSFVDAIDQLAALRCPHLVTFVGAMWSTPASFQAVVEYMDMGDLRSVLDTSPDASPWRTKLEWVRDAAVGLAYLHGCSIVHQAFQSRVILLATNKPAKLANVGRRRNTRPSDALTSGTWRWLAPERLTDSGPAVPALDVYALGVVLTEVDTCLVPYADMQTSVSGQVMTDIEVVKEVQSGQLRPSLSEACSLLVRQLALQCMAQNPSDRPHASEVASTLRQVL
ncbi:Aste57867_18015 [Aphanomyces stellatus]|uniref:Aste57867_18015 protein n=1 Tax=Aphanomyces stellatus TaxID=120398 RepID=A0A485L978_9STRA|nr:hypothetical protein As57867_017953 [Aphanomyces stellatus]VFT94754.1 Aste57867_18015 [Aphanomyces stellatus]